jgi:hypothetical protein
MVRKIFVNYRRADDPNHAGRHLRRHARGGESERPEFAHKLPARVTGTNSRSLCSLHNAGSGAWAIWLLHHCENDFLDLC